MKITHISLAMVLAISSCSKKTVESSTDTSGAQKANELAAELRSMEQQEEKLRREIELERLAMEREELRIQREALTDQGKRLSDDELALQKERTALAEQRAADAEAQARADATPLPPQPSQSVGQQPYRPAPVTVSQTPVSALGDYDYSVFYDRLSGHGSWLQSPDYGYVWRPSVYVSNRDWRPYTNGSWAHTDYGWTWVSNEPFGWATYHYGRWVLLRNTGWCWVPGNEWAPAWVCWKSGGDYVGWAPLPPESLYWRGNDWTTYYGNSAGISPRCFSFVRVSSFGSAIISAVFSSNDCIRIYQQTNYVGGYHWNNRRVYCEGISYDLASRQAGRQLTRYHCDFENRPPSSRDPLLYASRQGDRLSIHAPNFNVPWNGALRPRSYDNKPLQDEVIRESSFEPRLRDRFIGDRNRDREHAEESMRGGLAQKMTERIALEEKISRQRDELASTLETVNPTQQNNDRDQSNDRDKDKDKDKERGDIQRPQDSNREPGGREQGPGQPGVMPDPTKEPRPDQKPSDNRGEDRPQRPDRPNEVIPGQVAEQKPDIAPQPPVTEMPKRDAENQPDKSDREESSDRNDRTRQFEEARQRQDQEKQQRAMREEQEKAARAQEQQQQSSQQNTMREQLRDRQEQENRRDAEQKAAQEAEKAAKQQAEREEKGRESQQRMLEEQQKQLKKQQQEQVEIRNEQEKALRVQAEMQQREAARAREAQDQQKQDQMRQQQEAARAAQEQARQEQMREAQEQSRRAQMQQQQEAARAAQEQARQEQMREAQEQSRRAQMQQQQEAARAAQEQARQEQMREAQEQSRQEQMREAQEQSRRDQMRQQQDAAREAQEQSRRQEESNRQQQQNQENQGRNFRDRR